MGGDGFGGARFGFLAANVRWRHSGLTVFPAYGIRQFEDVRIAIIGLTLEGTPGTVIASGVAGLEFDDEAETVNALVPQLKAAGVEAIVVLIHQGGEPAYVLHVDFGEELGVRKSSAQVTALYRPEDLVGRLVVAVLNFPPKQVGPLMSQCLVTGFHNARGEVALCVPDQDVPLGTRLL